MNSNDPLARHLVNIKRPKYTTIYHPCKETYLVDGARCGDILQYLEKISDKQLVSDEVKRLRYITDRKSINVMPCLYYALSNVTLKYKPVLTGDTIVWYNELLGWLNGEGCIPCRVAKVIGCNKYRYGTYIDLIACSPDKSKFLFADFVIDEVVNYAPRVGVDNIYDMIAASKVQAFGRMYNKYFYNRRKRAKENVDSKYIYSDLWYPLPDFYHIHYNKYKKGFTYVKADIQTGWEAVKETMVRDIYKRVWDNTESKVDYLARMLKSL